MTPSTSGGDRGFAGERLIKNENSLRSADYYLGITSSLRNQEIHY